MRTSIYLLAMASVFFGPSGMGMAMDDVAVPEGADWRAEPNRGVVNDNHWRWTLRSVERVGDKLTVTLHVKNNATTGRPLLLEDQYLKSIVLVDEAADIRFPLLVVDGISEQITAVKRRKGKSAVFTFAYPVGAKMVRFTSKWISMRMGGEASIMEVDFKIDIPPAKARPS
jgi:hypothetical protein